MNPKKYKLINYLNIIFKIKKSNILKNNRIKPV